jgi:hypothetical protein
MGNRYGEWIHDVESFQFAVSEDNARGDNYAGSHVLYQDVTVPVPTMMDGTSNTFMYAEKFRLPDGEYVLTAIQHHANEPSSAGGEDNRGLWQINLEPGKGNIQKGGWISDVTYEASGGNAVAMETLTIAHEGLLLL